MGWWQMSKESPGIHKPFETDKKMVMGDALDKIIEEYEEYWERKPYIEELEAAFEFVLGGLTFDDSIKSVDKD